MPKPDSRSLWPQLEALDDDLQTLIAAVEALPGGKGSDLRYELGKVEDALASASIAAGIEK